MREAINELIAYIDVIIAIIVQIKNSEEFRVGADLYFFCILDSFAEGLSRILLHLDVIKLSVYKQRQQILDKKR